MAVRRWWDLAREKASLSRGPLDGRDPNETHDVGFESGAAWACGQIGKRLGMKSAAQISGFAAAMDQLLSAETSPDLSVTEQERRAFLERLSCST